MTTKKQLQHIIDVSSDDELKDKVWYNGNVENKFDAWFDAHIYKCIWDGDSKKLEIYNADTDKTEALIEFASEEQAKEHMTTVYESEDERVGMQFVELSVIKDNPEIIDDLEFYELADEETGYRGSVIDDVCVMQSRHIDI